MQRDLSGVVERGRGLGADRTAEPHVLELLRRLAGCLIVPGTLNVRLSKDLERGSEWRYLAAPAISPRWRSATGQAGYHLAPVTIAGRYRGLALQADELSGSAYPKDLVEVLSEVHLRTTLGLADGDHLVVTLDS